MSSSAYFCVFRGLCRCLCLAAAVVLAGCGPKGGAPVAPPSGGPPGATGTAGSAKGEKEAVPVASLPVGEDAEFVVEAEPKSLAVVEHFDAELAKQGWEKLKPKSTSEPGQREWVHLGASVGPSDAYEAAWTNPKTGQTAVLNVWHRAGEPNRQHGTFELRGSSGH